MSESSRCKEVVSVLLLKTTQRPSGPTWSAIPLLPLVSSTPSLSLTLWIHGPSCCISNDIFCLRVSALAVLPPSTGTTCFFIPFRPLPTTAFSERLSLTTPHERHSPSACPLCFTFLCASRHQLPEIIFACCVSSLPMIISSLKGFLLCFVHCCFPRCYDSPWHLVGASYGLAE